VSSESPDGNPVTTYLGLEEIGDTPVERKLTDMKRRKTKRRVYALVGFLGSVVLFSLSADLIGFSVAEIFRQIPEFTEALREYFPITTVAGIPVLDVGQYWAFMQEENLIMRIDSGGSLFGLGIFTGSHIVPGAMFETMAIAIAGTMLGLPGALFFGVTASERVIPYPFNFLFRGVMSLIRAIPALVWVLILIPLGGVSSFTATLAIGIDTFGYLGRLFTDELEEIAEGPIEGIRSVGASKMQAVSFGMLSQVFRQFIAWTAFDLEHNVRVAIGLGIIGAGGLGLELNIQRRTFNYTEMMACIILILLLAGSVELLSQRVRSYLRDDDEVETEGIVTILLRAPVRILGSLAGRRDA
jgi:phosphonate transport system permease protein